MILFVLYSSISVISVAYLIDYIFNIRDDVREPSRLRSRIPLIGHLIGIISSGPSYHSTLKFATCPRL